MNAEFNVWLLIVGLVVGAGLAWLVMMDNRRREAEIDATELPREAAWLSAVMAEDGHDVSPDAAEHLLLLHRAYLGAPPPDPIVEEVSVREIEPVKDDVVEDDEPGGDALDGEPEPPDGEPGPSAQQTVPRIDRERIDEQDRAPD